jgi:iron(III) transport system substrate-binding protein
MRMYSAGGVGRRGVFQNRGPLKFVLLLAWACWPCTALTQDMDPQILAAARREGQLVIYNGSNFRVVKMIAGEFEKAYGLPVDVLDGRALEIRERIRVEQATGRNVGDMNYAGNSSLESQLSDGFLQAHEDLPNGKLIEAPLQDNGTIVPTAVGTLGILINSGLVSAEAAPKSWLDLIDQRWRGKLLIDDPRGAGAGGTWFEVMLNKISPDYHKKLAVQKPFISREQAESYRRIARGEYPIYAPFNVSDYAGLRGLPIRVVIPQEGVPYVPFGIAILKNAPHPNAARLFLNYVLAPPAQIMLAAEGFRPATGGATGDLPSDLASFAKARLLGRTTPGRLDEMVKLATELYQ